MTPTRWLDDREARAWRSLQQMQMRLEGRLARALFEESGLSYTDYVVLVVLTGEPEGQLRLYELAEILGWERSRLSHHIARMVERGLVRKEHCALDRRGLFVVVTDQGRREIAAAAPGHVAVVRELFVDVLDEEQLAQLAEIAETVIANLERHETPGIRRASASKT